MKIIRASVKDVDLIFQVEKDCFNDYYGKEQLLKDLENTNQNYIYIAYQEDIIVGYCFVSKVLDEIELLRIAVLKDFRGKGCGEDILHKVLSYFKDGCKTCFLEVSVDNLSAISLYQKVGFKNISIRKQYYSDGSNALNMSLNFDNMEF